MMEVFRVKIGAKIVSSKILLQDKQHVMIRRERKN